ncbi:MAG: hypothetical protein ACLFV0_02225 [Nitriliruptoraceae bacterium]
MIIDNRRRAHGTVLDIGDDPCQIQRFTLGLDRRLLEDPERAAEIVGSEISNEWGHVTPSSDATAVPPVRAEVSQAGDAHPKFESGDQADRSCERLAGVVRQAGVWIEGAIRGH